MSTEAAAPIEKLAVDPETLGNMTLALGTAARNIVPGVLPDERTELDKDLDSSRVKQVRGKDYLAEHDVVRTANRIFGYGRWGTTVKWQELVGSAPMKNAHGEDGWYTGYRCCVELTVAGCLPVDGIGYGDAFEKQWSAQVTTHELAAKEAESDAIKRAFKKFGDQFGLILYAKADDKKRIAAEKAQAEYDAPASEKTIEFVVECSKGVNLHDQTVEAVQKERDAHGFVRVGWLEKLASRIAAIAEKPAEEAKPAPAEEAKPAETAKPSLVPAAAAKLTINAPDREATPDEVAALLAAATAIDIDSGAKMSQLVLEHRDKVEGGGVSFAWLTKAKAAVDARSSGTFSPPAAATAAASDDEVAQAFTGAQAA